MHTDPSATLTTAWPSAAMLSVGEATPDTRGTCRPWQPATRRRGGVGADAGDVGSSEARAFEA